MRGFLRKLTALVLCFVLAAGLLYPFGTGKHGAEASAENYIQGPIIEGGIHKIARRDYYDTIVNTIQKYGLYNPYFDYRSQNVLGRQASNAYACAGFVAAVLYYGGFGEEIQKEFRSWGGGTDPSANKNKGNAHINWTGDKGLVNYGHGAPELLMYYLGHYKYSNSTPATPYYGYAAATKWWVTDGTKQDWITKWELASYKVPESNGGYSMSVYNDLAKDYNDGKIAAGDIILFIQWDSKSSAAYQTSITHIGIIGAPTAYYDQAAIKKYLGKDYVSGPAITGLTGAKGDTATKKTVLTTLNITDNTDWYNAALGMSPLDDPAYNYNHAAYEPLPCFFDPNGTVGRHKLDPERTSRVANGYIVYRRKDEKLPAEIEKPELFLDIYNNEGTGEGETGYIDVSGIEDGNRYYGDASFNVKCSEACMALLSLDGGKSYEILPAEKTDKPDVYGFSFEMTKDSVVAVAKAGDVTMDGKVNSVDAMEILKYDVKKISLSPEGLILGNVAKRSDGGVPDSEDAMEILKADVKKLVLEW